MLADVLDVLALCVLVLWWLCSPGFCCAADCFLRVSVYSSCCAVVFVGLVGLWWFARVTRGGFTCERFFALLMVLFSGSDSVVCITAVECGEQLLRESVVCPIWESIQCTRCNGNLLLAGNPVWNLVGLCLCFPSRCPWYRERHQMRFLLVLACILCDGGGGETSEFSSLHAE